VTAKPTYAPPTYNSSSASSSSSSKPPTPSYSATAKPSAFAQLPMKGTIDPARVLYSQDSISAWFQDDTSIDDLAESLAKGWVAASDIPTIRIVERSGKLVTLDNRRLYAFKKAKIHIYYVKWNSVPEWQLSKFTANSEGSGEPTIRVRWS
jgi:hypothetical protein